jgi:hypothetical protein
MIDVIMGIVWACFGGVDVYLSLNGRPDCVVGTVPCFFLAILHFMSII